jgi:large subunit ribosomal protein L23
MSKRVLIKPHVTEKSSRQMEEGKYSFVVGLEASKPEIRAAIEHHYPGVKIESVRTMIVPGKRRRQFRRGSSLEGRTSGYKKAIVKIDLVEGEVINFYENV